ncbi:MAG: HAMP domain-containing protein, partial [Actinobacteria bacterium]|nr:HAMP domain-containing protein [Actinomycetota bacterium]
ALTLRIWKLLGVGVLTFAVATIPLIAYVNRVAGFPQFGLLLLAVGVQVLVAGSAFVNFFVFEALARPILRDVSRLLPPDFEIPRRGPGLAVKILAASVVIPAYAGILLIGATGWIDSPLGLLGVGIAILAFVTLTLSLPLSALLARSVVSPVESLVRASREVRSGNLGTRVPITSSDEIGHLAESFNEMVEGLRERHSLQAAMGVYVDPVIAQRVLREGHILEGEETDVTIMFLDVRDFTSRSERMTPAEAVAYLNRLFSLIVPVVAEHGGHVNKFLGDGLLAVFGAPGALADHPARAVAAARAIVRTLARDNGDGTRIGIGLNSGPVVAGTVGGGAHLEFGLIGDTVNVAARIEEHTKETGDAILVSEATRSRVRGLRGTSRGDVTLRGREDSVRVYAVGAAAQRAVAKPPARSAKARTQS